MKASFIYTRADFVYINYIYIPYIHCIYIDAQAIMDLRAHVARREGKGKSGMKLASLMCDRMKGLSKKCCRNVYVLSP